MLTYAHRCGDQIDFPQSEISVHFLELDAESAIVGIDAPPGTEIVSKGDIDSSNQNVRVDDPACKSGEAVEKQESTHRLRNHLNSVALALHVIQSQVANGQQFDADLLDEAIKQLEEVEL